LKPPELPFLKTPEDWNKFLLRRYGYGLFEYMTCFAFYLADPSFKLRYTIKDGFPEISDVKHAGYYKELRDKLRRKKAEKKAILKGQDLTADERSYNCWVWAAPPHVLEHLEQVSLDIRRMEEELFERPIWIRGRGRRVEIRNVIASIFAQVTLKNGQTEWTVIEEFFCWVFHLLGEVHYREFLGERTVDFVYYKFQKEYEEITKHGPKEYEIQRWAEIFFPSSGEIKLHKIEFAKFTPLIEEEHSKDPVIKFPDGTEFKEDFELRKRVAVPRVAHKLSRQEREMRRQPEKTIRIVLDKKASEKYEEYKKMREKEKEERPLTLVLTREDLANLQKYKELMKEKGRKHSIEPLECL